MSLVFKISPPPIGVPRFSVANKPSENSRRVRTTIYLTIIVSLLVTIYRWPPPPTPLKASRRIVNAGIWTVHFGVDNAGLDSQRRMMDLIRWGVIGFTGNLTLILPYRDMDLDLLGLLETDLHVWLPF